VISEVRQRTRQIRRESARTNRSVDDGQSIALQPNFLLSTPGLPGARSPDARSVVDPAYVRPHLGQGHDSAFLVQPDLELPVFARMEVRGEQGVAEIGDGPTAQRDSTGRDPIPGYRPQPSRIINPLGAASCRGEGTVLRESRRPDELPVDDEPTVRYDRLSFGESLENV
jgi:hypothetical protein